MPDITAIATAAARRGLRSSPDSNRHGAVMIRSGRVVSTGYNTRIGIDPGYSEVAWRSSYVHAEEMAIKAAGYRAYGATLYIIRLAKNGAPHENIAPCPRCQRVIAKYGVKRVVPIV